MFCSFAEKKVNLANRLHKWIPPEGNELLGGIFFGIQMLFLLYFLADSIKSIKFAGETCPFCPRLSETSQFSDTVGGKDGG